MKKLFLIFVFFGFAVVAKAQDPTQPNILLTLTDGKIVAERTGYGTFSVEVLATTPEGEVRQIFQVTQPTKMLTMDGNPDVSSVKWNWLQGALDSAVDTTFVYQLPYHYSWCRKAQAHALSNADLKIYRGNFSNFRVWQFDVRKGTKIYPMRAGDVIAVNERQGSITIEHSDGSQAEYSVLGKGLQVVEGQQVTTDTQLGIAGEINGEPMVRIALYCYRTNQSQIHQNMMSQTLYLDPLFKKGKLVDGKKY